MSSHLSWWDLLASGHVLAFDPPQGFVVLRSTTLDRIELHVEAKPGLFRLMAARVCAPVTPANAVTEARRDLLAAIDLLRWASIQRKARPHLAAVETAP